DPVAFVAAARRRASKQRRSRDDITTEDRTYDLSREDVPVVREPADEHLEALARLRALHAPVISPGRERQPVTHGKEQTGVEEADRKRSSPVVAEGLSSADGATKGGDTGRVEDSGSRGNRRVIEVKTYAEASTPQHTFAQFWWVLAARGNEHNGSSGAHGSRAMSQGKGLSKVARHLLVKHFSRQLRRINAEKLRGKSRPREDDRVSTDARSRGLEFHRRQRERHMMNGEARNRRPRKSNSERPGPKEEEQAAEERARLEELLQRHDRLRATVDGFRRHKQTTLDPSKLEYRLAKPTDVLLSDKLEDKAAIFVAYDTKTQAVVGSVEFGVVQEATYENKETVFLPWLEMIRGWTNQDVAVEMLRHLLGYIKRVRPQVAYVWTRENWGAKEEFADKVCKKAGFKTLGAPNQWYDYMYTFPKTESSVEASDGGDGVIPLIPGPYDVV
ncbi:hypothetical protein FOZ62_028930, partial [Perkinsus olseni]